MTKEKIECPEWLEKPERYDITKEFTIQDWFEQVCRRHGLADQIEKKQLDSSLNDILKINIIVPSAATLNSIGELMKLKPSLFQESDFKQLGLVYDSVWSQSIKDVRLRNNINQVIQNKHDFISDDFPNKVCEQLVRHDQDFFGVASINVDLFLDDDLIRKEFRQWLKSARNFYKYNEYAKIKFNNWAKYRSLAYWDLMLWIKENNYSYGSQDSQIPKATMQEWLLGDKITGKYYGNYNLIEASKRDYEAMSKGLMSVVLQRRSFSDENTSSMSSVQITKKIHTYEENKLNIIEYFKKNGFPTKS